jgi:hypothetical protein
MNWEAFGAIAEGLGAAGVLVTLIYLVGQVRTSNRLARSESRRSSFQATTPVGLAIAHDRELAELWATGLRDPDTLDGADRIRFTWLMACAMVPMYLSHQDRRLGLLTEADATNQREGQGPMLDSPGGRWWWDRRKGAYDLSFVEYVEGEILRAEPRE